MPPVYTYNDAIIVSNGAIAASESCCCSGTGVPNECCAFYLMMSHPSGYVIDYCPDLTGLGPYENSTIIVNEFFVIENTIPPSAIPGESGCLTRQDAEELAEQIKSDALSSCPELIEISFELNCIEIIPDTGNPA